MSFSTPCATRHRQTFTMVTSYQLRNRRSAAFDAGSWWEQWEQAVRAVVSNIVNRSACLRQEVIPAARSGAHVTGSDLFPPYARKGVARIRSDNAAHRRQLLSHFGTQA